MSKESKRSVLEFLKRFAPSLLHGPIENSALRWGYRPRVDANPVPCPLKRGAIVVSADFELAWAWRYSSVGIQGALEKARWERQQVPLIKNLLEELQIPITWATVGHLFLESCERSGPGGLTHNEMPRPSPYENAFWNLRSKDWMEHDPAGNVSTHPEWYAPDLVELLLRSRVKHDWGCHSFSHMDLSDKSCTPELFDFELSESRRAMARFGLSPVSFVYPGNLAGHTERLSELGFQIARHYPWADIEMGWLRAFETQSPVPAYGLFQSYLLESEGWEISYLKRKLLRLIDIAVESRQLVSLWFHPSLSRFDFEELFKPVLAYCAKLRDSGSLDVFTMAQLAAMESSRVHL